MTWSYRAKRHRWEASAHGWRAIAQRAPNGGDWEATIEPLDGGARIASAVVFRSSEAAGAKTQSRGSGWGWPEHSAPHPPPRRAGRRNSQPCGEHAEAGRGG